MLQNLFLGDILQKFFEQHMIFPRKFVHSLIGVKRRTFKFWKLLAVEVLRRAHGGNFSMAWVRPGSLCVVNFVDG